MRNLLLLFSASLLLIACGDNTSDAAEGAPDAPATDSDTPGGTDGGAADSEDPDTGPGIDPDEAGPIRVGVGRTRLPAPVGIGTAGYGPFSEIDGPQSRYAENFPATVGMYTHPTFHAVAVEGPHQTIVFVRSDTIAVSLELRSGIIARIIEKGGPDLSQGLLFAATHTHSGPGRLVRNLILEAGFDVFFPAFFDRMIEAVADVVIQALDDLEPARFGYTILNTDALHKDRRCESPETLDGSLPVLRFDRMDGTVKALVMSYSAHGTIVDIDKRRLSRDFHGGIEMKIEERFEQPVTALFFNSWSGDTAPTTGTVDEDHGIPSDYNGIEAAGNIAADLVMAAMDSINMSDEAAVRGGFAHMKFDRQAMGYEDGIWQFEYGAVYCGIGADAPCFGEGDLPDPISLSNGCIPFGEEFPAPNITTVGMLRVGDLWLATLPAEPGTQIGTLATSTIKDSHGLADVMLIGYAQDYIGYHLTEEDWYRGGYEASGSIWGPLQGEYVNQHLIAFADSFINQKSLTWEEASPRPPYDLTPEEIAFVEEEAAILAVVMIEPKTAYTAGETVLVTFAGGDPWLLAPTVFIEKQAADGGFEPVVGRNTLPIDSDGYMMELTLVTDPSYNDVDAPVARTFEWTVALPTRRGAPSTNPVLQGGPYRLKITGLIAADTPYEITTQPFSID